MLHKDLMDIMFDQSFHVVKKDMPVTLNYEHVIFVMEDIDAASPIVRARVPVSAKRDGKKKKQEMRTASQVARSRADGVMTAALSRSGAADPSMAMLGKLAASLEASHLDGSGIPFPGAAVEGTLKFPGHKLAQQSDGLPGAQDSPTEGQAGNIEQGSLTEVQSPPLAPAVHHTPSSSTTAFEKAAVVVSSEARVSNEQGNEKGSPRKVGLEAHSSPEEVVLDSGNVALRSSTGRSLAESGKLASLSTASAAASDAGVAGSEQQPDLQVSGPAEEGEVKKPSGVMEADSQRRKVSGCVKEDEGHGGGDKNDDDDDESEEDEDDSEDEDEDEKGANEVKAALLKSLGGKPVPKDKSKTQFASKTDKLDLAVRWLCLLRPWRVSALFAVLPFEGRRSSGRKYPHWFP